MGLESEVVKYLNSRKVVKRAFKKVLKNLKGMGNKCIVYSFNKDDETVPSTLSTC